ncbi:MAG: hypothetical protein OEL83_08075 [Desulforhopalus sp.]|nr:hypothetical protein [Desulforhopalus sp.]
MQKDTYVKLASLILLLAVLSSKILLEDYQQNQRTRLFAYLDSVVRCIDVINGNPIDRDTTRTSNETISSIMHSKWRSHLINDPLLIMLKEYIGNAPLVPGFHNLFYRNRSPLDPDASFGVTNFNLTTDSTIPTRVWSTSSSGYGSGMSRANRFILLVPSLDFERISLTNEPILLEQGDDGKIFELSIPRAIKPMLEYWALRPAKMKTFLSENNHSPLPPYSPDLLEKGKRLVQSGLFPMVEMMSYDQFRAEIIRLASIQNDKSYSDQQLKEALIESLRRERATINVFGITFSRDFFALVFPMVYLFSGYSIFQAARPPFSKRKTLVPRDKLELLVLMFTFCLMIVSIVPIGFATVQHLTFLTATGLPEQPGIVKYIVILSPLCMGFSLLVHGLYRETKRILSNTALHRMRKSNALVS